MASFLQEDILSMLRLSAFYRKLIQKPAFSGGWQPKAGLFARAVF
jgi:hypothetical protein